jgi:molybdopterin synthase sulfur carrier subunit
MRVKVRLFARLRDLVGSGEFERDLPPSGTVQAVWDDLVAETPSLRDYERAISVAVNTEYARMSARLADGDEVAFLPPVSGG